MATIETRREEARGCGFRKGGGIYLVNDGPGRGCGRMPIPLHVCPTCSQGIKPARGWTWIDGKAILAATPLCKSKLDIESRPDGLVSVTMTIGMPPACESCPFSGTNQEKVGLMWVGGKFYPSPEDFVKEAQRMGLSKRIAQIPKDLVVGKTWIWLAHRMVMPAIHDDECQAEHPDAAANPSACSCPDGPRVMTPGVFHAFVPTRIEYVVKGDETEAELDALEKRGLSLVKVERIGENGELLLDAPIPKIDPIKENHDDGDV